MGKKSTTVACCLPGETFSMHWVRYWTDLFASLRDNGFTVLPYFAHSSSVYVTRGSMHADLLAAPVPIDYVLWLDDDNLLNFPDFARLLQDLKEHPEASAVGAWTWIDIVPPILSCGRLAADKTTRPFSKVELDQAAREGKLLEAGYTGFPAILMRYEMLVQAGKHPFAPILGEHYHFGLTGEDLSFVVNARERGGCRTFIDPRVHTPHLKIRMVTGPDAEPVDLTKQEAA